MIPGTLSLSLTLLPFALARVAPVRLTATRWRLLAGALLLAPGTLLAGKSGVELAAKAEPASLGGSFTSLIGGGPTVNLGGVEVIMMPGASAPNVPTVRPALDARRAGNAAASAQPGSRCVTLAQAGTGSRNAPMTSC